MTQFYILYFFIYPSQSIPSFMPIIAPGYGDGYFCDEKMKVKTNLSKIYPSLVETGHVTAAMMESTDGMALVVVAARKLFRRYAENNLIDETMLERCLNVPLKMDISVYNPVYLSAMKLSSKILYLYLFFFSSHNQLTETIHIYVCSFICRMLLYINCLRASQMVKVTCTLKSL